MIYNYDKYDPMQIINDTLFDDSKEARQQLGEALYALFKHFDNKYIVERERMDRNEKLYHGKHWEEQRHPGDPNAPKPVTPIIFSTIENIEADMSNKKPTPTIKPENMDNADFARALTRVCEQDLDANDWSTESDMLVHDLLVGGWCVQEVGFDSYAMQGKGCAYDRRVAPRGFMCDPVCENLQDGRACFKFGKRTREWFRQHYQKDFEEICYVAETDDTHVPNDTGVITKSVLIETQQIIEAWVKIYDKERNRSTVHMITLAGDHVLEVSTDVKRGGYYMHGQYPFVLTALYPVDGTPFGLGIPDMFEGIQLYSDKIDQIILKNAYLASHNKLLVTDASGFDAEDLANWTKDVHTGESLGGITWFPTPPLPNYIIELSQLMKQSIKTESGANDQARGQTSGGVTAASAINALQIMATKRSTKHSQGFHAAFKQAVRMMLDVEREFTQGDREVVIMSHGRPLKFTVKPEDFARMGDEGKPIEYYIVIETSDLTQYSKMANNELALQIMQIYKDTIDPIALLYMMDFPDKDIVIEMIQDGRNSQLIQMQAQMQQMAQAIEQLSKENEQYKRAFSKQAGVQAQEAYRQQAQTAMAQQSAPEDMPPEQQEAFLNAMAGKEA